MESLRAVTTTRLSLDKQRTRTKIFNPIEIEHANSVFKKIEDVICENDYHDIITKYVSISRCLARNMMMSSS
jgi:hypothetical protein